MIVVLRQVLWEWWRMSLGVRSQVEQPGPGGREWIGLRFGLGGLPSWPDGDLSLPDRQVDTRRGTNDPLRGHNHMKPDFFHRSILLDRSYPRMTCEATDSDRRSARTTQVQTGWVGFGRVASSRNAAKAQLVSSRRASIVPDGLFPRTESAHDVQDLQDPVLRRLIPGSSPERFEGEAHLAASHPRAPVFPQGRDDLLKGKLRRDRRFQLLGQMFGSHSLNHFDARSASAC